MNHGHEIKTEKLLERVEIYFDGEKIADTRHAIKLEEEGYSPVYYVPKEDLVNVELVHTNKHTTCPFKGEADYYSLKHGPALWESFGWAYNEPIPEMSVIKGLIAFDPKQIEFISIGDD